MQEHASAIAEVGVKVDAQLERQVQIEFDAICLWVVRKGSASDEGMAKL